MPENSKVYAQSALFKCSNCNHQLEIYSEMEWFYESGNLSSCKQCWATDFDEFNLVVAYRFQPEREDLFPDPFSSIVGHSPYS
jgi:hypothetical protein